MMIGLKPWRRGSLGVRFTSTFQTLRHPKISIELSVLRVHFDTHFTSRFDNIWLRDHCRCSQCFHQVTRQRLLDTFAIPRDITIHSTHPTQDGITIHWNESPTEHVSYYPWSWLKHNSYNNTPNSRTKYSTSQILWGSEISTSLPIVSFNDVMKDEGAVYNWLNNLAAYGLSFVSDVPQTPEATEQLVLRIGFIRETQYGKFWDFTSDLAHGDTAYTDIALAPHTDNTYFDDPAALQLFHLLSHTNGTGGKTLLVDGFHCARLLSEANPRAHELLCTVPIPAHAAGEPGRIYTTDTYTPLTYSPWGTITSVRWNNSDRSTMGFLPSNVSMREWYDAIHAWNAVLEDGRNRLVVQLKPGTAVVVDNHRILHGRTEFTGKRRMCGAYVGSDVWKSRLVGLRDGIKKSVNEGPSVWSLEF